MLVSWIINAESDDSIDDLFAARPTVGARGASEQARERRHRPQDRIGANEGISFTELPREGSLSAIWGLSGGEGAEGCFLSIFFPSSFQLKRYKTYVYLLSSHINSNPTDNIINIIIGANNSAPTTPTTTLGEEDELKPLGAGVNLPNSQQGTNRYSYRAAIYRSDSQDIGWRVMGVFSACVV